MTERPEKISHLVPGFGNEQWIPGSSIERTCPLEVRYVDIGSEQIDGGSRRPVNVHHAGNRATARPLTRQLRLRLGTEPRIHIHGYIQLGLPLFRDLVDIPPHVIGHEDLISPLVLAEDLLPATLCLVTVFPPDLLNFGQQGVFVLCEVAHQVVWSRPSPGRFRHRRMVPAVTQTADLVLNLHHDDRMLRIDILDMTHQCSEGPGVSPNCVPAKRTQRPRALLFHVLGQKRTYSAIRPHLQDHGWKALRVCPDPVRSIARTRVLPSCEPDQHETHTSLSCLIDLVVNEREVKLALLWFN